MKLSSLALLLLVAGAAQGACPAVVPSNRACVEWKASVDWTDGTPFSQGTVVTYTVYLVTSPTTGTVIATTTQLFKMTPVLPAGKKCFVVSATVNGVESDHSNEGCKVIRFPGPTDGKIEGPTDGAIEPK